MNVYMRFFVFLGLLGVAVAAGLYLGRISVRDDPIALPKTTQPSGLSDSAPTNLGETQPKTSRSDPPVYFHVGKAPAEGGKVTGDQVSMASAAGVHRFIVPMPLHWAADGKQEAAQEYVRLLERYVGWDERASFLLSVNLNPPISWIEHHSEAAMRINNALQPYPSVASPVWREHGEQALLHLIATIASSAHAGRVRGFILEGLLEQRWMLPVDFDHSESNRLGFARWLRGHYRTEESLQNAWADGNATFDSAPIPSRPDTNDLSHVFFILPEMQPLVDFLRYGSEEVADTLAGFASLITRAALSKPLVLAAYGYSYESLSNGCGHFALELLLESDLGGFISPISYVDRGLGGVGGLMGPVDSVTVRGRQWLVVDDTRTGVERDEATGEYARIRGIRAEDVYEVQRRNFSLALVHDLGLVWSDPEAEGWLNDREQWKQLAHLLDVYEDNAASIEERHSVAWEEATLTVVIDEASRFYQQCDARVNTALLQKGRDAVMRSGVSARFHLLRDIIEDVAPPTPVYLFLNAFRLNEEERARLHSRLAREQACAIWMYAPGYIADSADAANITATTGMDVRAFEEPTETGSVFLLTGQYMHSQQYFGSGEVWGPLFYLEQEEETDFLAHYVADDNKGSIGIITLPEGWTSVYIAEPEISAPLLCEILRLLEHHLYPNPVERVYHDVVFARNGLLAIHAAQAGKRSLSLGRFYDVVDLIDPSIGWFQKESIMVPLRAGETRLLSYRPIEAGAL